MKVNGGRLFAKQLKKEGVEQIFTICGGQIMPVIYGCRAEGIQVVDVRHENAGTYAADAYARMTGKPGVVLPTLTPGVMQVMQGVFEARAAKTPMIILSSSVPVCDYDTGASQDMGMDTITILRENTVWAARVHETARIPEYVAKAFRMATGPTPGPVYLETPYDVMKAMVDEDSVVFPEYARTDAQPYGDPLLVEQAARLLAQAERPVLVVGDACVYSAQHIEAARELAQYLKMPVYATTVARGLVGDEDDALFRIGAGALREADVVLTLSLSMDYRVGRGRAPMICEGAHFIQIHEDRRAIGFNAPAHVGIVAGAGAAATQLLNAVKRIREPRRDDAWQRDAEVLQAAYQVDYEAAYVHPDIHPMHPARCAAEVCKFLEGEGRDWSVAVDGGDAYDWMMRKVRAHRPGQVVGFNVNGTIGTGHGFAMGAWCAHKKPVLYYTGDGSVGFYAGEFDTMERHGMQIICVVANDSQWGMVKMAETSRNPSEVAKGYIATDLADRRYDKLAEVFGCYGEHVEKPEEIAPAIRRAYASGKPAIIDVKVAQGYPCPYTVAYGCAGKEA